MRVVTRMVEQPGADLAEVCTGAASSPGPPEINDADFAEWDRAMRVLANLPPARPEQQKAPRE